MIIIVASRWDTSAQLLAERWAAHDARLLTPRDLSRPGWRQRLGQPGVSVVGGELVPEHRIAGVFMRLPSIYEDELTHIVPADRAFVAAEMTAFLTFWLTSLTCPVINRPTAGYLAGPSWRPEEWAQLAAQAGLTVPPRTLPSSQPAQEPVARVTVAGGQCFGDPDPLRRLQSLQLAELSQVALLSVEFSATGFLGVSLFPDLSDENLDAALLQCFEPLAQVLA